MRIILLFILFISLLPPAYAESVKYLQWWDEYLPLRKEMTTNVAYGRAYEVIYDLDLDDDGVAKDTKLCIPFSLEDKLAPKQQCPRTNPKSVSNYRLERPSANFYGGMYANYLNVGDTTIIKSSGEEVPAIRSFIQASVQNDGASPNFYDESQPEHTQRALGTGSETFWADMTLFLMDEGWSKSTTAFLENPDAMLNFASVFLWKKADFINGGASAEKIVFDKTSKLSVDLTRQVDNVQEVRFVIQDGTELLISDYVVEGDENIVLAINPLDYKWSAYHPTECDILFDSQAATFEHRDFTDVQAVGVYAASSDNFHDKTVIIFDNVQLYATTHPTDDEETIWQGSGAAINAQGELVATHAQFSKGVTANGGVMKAKPQDQLDIRGMITVDPLHVEKNADIIAVIGYQATRDDSNILYFMLDKEGGVQAWDNSMTSLVPFIEDVNLNPEYRVQLLPVSMMHFKQNDTLMDEVVLGCDLRPLTYSGILNMPGIFYIYYGYRLKENDLIVFNAMPIEIEITP